MPRFERARLFGEDRPRQARQPPPTGAGPPAPAVNQSKENAARGTYAVRLRKGAGAGGSNDAAPATRPARGRPPNRRKRMLLQTNSYVVPKEKRAEHARLLARFRAALAHRVRRVRRVRTGRLQLDRRIHRPLRADPAVPRPPAPARRAGGRTGRPRRAGARRGVLPTDRLSVPTAAGVLHRRLLRRHSFGGGRDRAAAGGAIDRGGVTGRCSDTECCAGASGRRDGPRGRTGIRRCRRRPNRRPRRGRGDRGRFARRG